MEKYLKRRSVGGGGSVDLPDYLEVIHMAVTLGLSPADLIALDQDARLMYAYHDGMELGREAMKEYQARMQRGN